MIDWRSSLEKCFGGGPFCWNQKPEELFCFIVQPKEGFPQGDTLYKYNHLLKKWVVECGPSGGCKEDCLVHAVQHNDPVYMDRVYYNVVDIKAHLDHHREMKKLKAVRKKENQ